MATKTADKTETTALAKIEPPRLPWRPGIETNYKDLGVTEKSWRSLTDVLYPAARSVNSIIMVLSMCSARKLDPFKKPFHIVPMWSSEKRRMVETVWPSIAEVRTTAVRTGEYAGKDACEFGPEITQKFEGHINKSGGGREAVRAEVTFPEWARITTYRIVKGHRCAFVGPKVYWRETYAQLQQSGVPNNMWAKRPFGQIEKCSEAASLRAAFPEETGSMQTAEEMEGQHLIEEAAAEPVVVEEEQSQETNADAPPEDVEDAEFSEPDVSDEPPGMEDAPEQEADAPPDPRAWIEQWKGQLAEAAGGGLKALKEVYGACMVDAQELEIFPGDQSAVEKEYHRLRAQIEKAAKAK